MKAPAGDVLDLLGRLRIAAATDGGDGGPARRVRRGEAPGAEAAYGKAGEVDSFLVSFVFLLDLLENGDGAFPLGAVGAPAAFL